MFLLSVHTSCSDGTFIWQQRAFQIRHLFISYDQVLFQTILFQVLSDSMSLHEQFAAQMKRSSDGFSVIADYFSKGVFNKVSYVTKRHIRLIT